MSHLGFVRYVATSAVVAVAVVCGSDVALAAPVGYSVGQISDLSSSCSGQNAEVEQAVDPHLGYVYEEWMGCRGIAFARSTDGGATFQTPISVPGSIGSNLNTWDPSGRTAPSTPRS